MRRKAWVQKSLARRCRVIVLGQTVYTNCTSVHQAAKLVAALLRVARVTAGLAESNGSLPPGLWLTSPAGWLPRTGIRSGTLRSAIEYWLPLLFSSDYLRYLRKKQSVIHLPTPLENAPHELVKYQTFYYLTEGLHCTCIFRTCVFQYLSFQRPQNEMWAFVS